MAVSVAGASAAMFGGGSRGGTGSFTGGLSRKKHAKTRRAASRTPLGPPSGGDERKRRTVVRHGSPKGSVVRVTPGVKSRPVRGSGGGRPGTGLGPKATRRMGRLMARGGTRV